MLARLFRDVPAVAESNMFLSGGTCLSAFYLGHRDSEDLDLFVAAPQLPLGGGRRLFSAIASAFQKELEERDGFKPMDENENFFSCRIMGTKVDFVADCFAFQEERPLLGFLGTRIRVDSWENLCVSKFAVFLSRGAEKDILDIGAILSHVENELRDPDRFAQFVEWLMDETQRREYLSNEISYVHEACRGAAEYLQHCAKYGLATAVMRFADTVRNIDEDIRQTVDIDVSEIGPER